MNSVFIQYLTLARIDFVRQMNNLNKEGYKIDKDKTDMEEFALMIKAAASGDLLST